MSEEPAWRRLHPASVAVNLVPRAWRVARQMWPVFVAVLWGGSGVVGSWVDLATVLGFFFVAVGSAVVHYMTLRYRVHGDRLEIVSGLVNRRVRVIDPKRIQNVELVRNVFHRLAGLVEVHVETASGSEVEGLLSALSEEDGRRLVDELRESMDSGPVRERDEPSSDAILEHDVGDLLRYGATNGRLGGGALLLVGIGFELLQIAEPGALDDMEGFLRGEGWWIVGVALVTGTWLVGIAAAVVRHWGFRLLREGSRLTASAGLFTQRRVELDLRKIQVVTVHQTLIRRALGFGSVHVETAAVREASDGTVWAEAVVPVVEADELGRLLEVILPGAGETTWARRLEPPDPRALYRRLVEATLRIGVLAVFSSGFLGRWSVLVLVVGLPGAWLGAWLQHGARGWWWDSGALVVSRRGFLDRRTILIPRAKVQSLEVHQGLLRRALGLGGLSIRVAGSMVTLPDMRLAEARRLQDGLVVASCAPAMPLVGVPADGGD